jgi:hypothetical protein
MMDEKPNIQDAEGTEFKSSPDAIAAADAALAAIADRSFSGRHPELGRMIKCQVCRSRHRSSQKCEQKFKQLWIDEDIETGELSIQYAIVPLPGQNGTPKSIVGAAYFAKKRKNPHPSRRKLQFIELVRKLIPDEYTQEDLKDARELAAEILGLNKTFADKCSKRKGYPFKKPKEEVINVEKI